MKKLFILLLLIMCTYACVACGNNKENEPVTQDNTTDNVSQENNTGNYTDYNTEVDEYQIIKFVGYDISYPSEIELYYSDYGNYLGNEDYFLILEAPAKAGILTGTDDLYEAITFCEEYLFKTLEDRISARFSQNKTSQTIETTTEVNYNGIDMLMVEGYFTNSKKEITIDFTAIYWLAGEDNNWPVYIVGFPFRDGFEGTDAIVKEIAKNIKR